ncbi:DegT/DnrJ/EryC1/StrS family aminotransferase [Sphingomonas sp. Mn802worker]|uniref:DegT/DnrJ/EryC1/StrS family aminotransferase n=1 Tax=Sphingomonas sp. Mn802worker TaxID=629773 RepID=UPI0003787F86|nr:DegT/DnrJ/EryC1/StrS family aminotransferase [Sphingomonas sp. Mn802worker]
MDLPLIAPNPPRLSDLTEALSRVEASGVYSNHGPEARAFEQEATTRLFAGRGATLTVNNATTGLMIALADAVGARGRGRMALMPGFTFAATAQAAWWAGLIPLVCDVDPGDWGASAREEERLLQRHGQGIAAIMPYATFGRAIDLDRYRWLAARHGVAVVVDAAASLGTTDAVGVNFGAGAPFPIVFSMHATKPFAVAEGGLIHCGDAGVIERLRAAANFGFTRPRVATVPGLNAKLPEVLAVMARAKLATFEKVSASRAAVVRAYRDALDGFLTMQALAEGEQAHGFFPVLLPRGCDRSGVIAALTAEGIGAGAYFSPHLGEQPWVREVAVVEPLPVCDDVAARVLSLPVTDTMTAADAQIIAATLRRVVARPRAAARPRTVQQHETLVIGGGPAGTALLTAASKAGVLPALSQGLAVVEAGASLGSGRLGNYAITSDSSADTFLTAVSNNPHDEIAALVDHPATARVAAHRHGLGVPLVEVGPMLDALGDRLAAVVGANGGQVLTGHRGLSARQDGGWWCTSIEDVASGIVTEHRARHVVIATGGHQPIDRLAAQEVAGVPLSVLAGGRLVQSDAVLSIGGTQMVADLIADVRNPRIAVVGGSTSAMTTIAALLKAPLPLGEGAITLLHRRPLRPFYPSVAAAQAEGFTDFGPDDICPVSGFVYRLTGFRLEARDLVLRMLSVDGRVPDPRVGLHRIAANEDARAKQIVEAADVVVAALGYRPHALSVFDRAGAPIALAADTGAAMVDRHCRVLDANGAPVAGLYGIGLAAGFVPWGRLGGEPSFRGQANGLWLWQNDVGMMIVDQLLGTQEKALAG